MIYTYYITVSLKGIMPNMPVWGTYTSHAISWLEFSTSQRVYFENWTETWFSTRAKHEGCIPAHGVDHKEPSVSSRGWFQEPL